jgi:hypothetical protein
LFCTYWLFEKKIVYCNHRDIYALNDLRLLNNKWGAKNATNSDCFQCINSINNQVTYKWTGSYSKVKGMPVVMAGGHYGNPGGWATPKGMHNLPSRISDNEAHYVYFSETHINKGTYSECLNCCIDIWLSNSHRGANSGEIMVWGNYINRQPVGSKIGSFDEYEIWKGDAGGWTCVTFRKTGNWSVIGNMNTFINYTISRG